MKLDSPSKQHGVVRVSVHPEDGESLDDGDFTKSVIDKVLHTWGHLCHNSATGQLMFIFTQDSAGFFMEMIMNRGTLTPTYSLIAKSQYDVLQRMLENDFVEYTDERKDRMKQMVRNDIANGVVRIYIQGDAFLVEHRQFASDAVLTVVRDISRSLSKSKDDDDMQLTDKDIITISNVINGMHAQLTKRLIIQFRGKIHVSDIYA